MTPVGQGASVQSILAMRSQVLERTQALQTLQGTPAAAPSGTDDGAVNFGKTLETALQNVNATQTRASSMAEAYERGETYDVAAVMLARQEAGVAFEATLQVRNKLLSAYQDIMRMGV